LKFDAQAILPPVAVKDLPPWITVEPIKPLDRRASDAIAKALPTDRPARVGLLELATARPQIEVKRLALRCLGCLGHFRDVVTALNVNDPMHRQDSWEFCIEQLRAAVGRDAETAAAVRLALEQQYPEQAAALYRMLWGYSNKDLEGPEGAKYGEDKILVEALDDNTLAVRVLAIWNLTEITGFGRGQTYRPEQTAARRQSSTRRWRERLDAKEIRHKAPEERSGAAAGEKLPPPLPGSVP
jgi:hypothetical protein